MEIDSKETWVLINIVPCAAKQHKTPPTTRAPPTAYPRLKLGAIVLPVCNLWWRCHSEWYATAEGAQLIGKIRAFLSTQGWGKEEKKVACAVKICFVRAMMDWSKKSHKKFELSDAFKVALSDKWHQRNVLRPPLRNGVFIHTYTRG